MKLTKEQIQSLASGLRKEKKVITVKDLYKKSHPKKSGPYSVI